MSDVARAGGMLLLHPFGSLGPPQPTQPAGHAVTGSLDAQAIYQRLEPSVVDVTSTLRYDDETASGTGFVVDGRAALVLTNNHVIRDATTVTATLTATGRTYRARIVGADVAADIAVLQLQGASGLSAAPLGNSAAVTHGAQVLAIGNQAGQGGSPTIAPGIIDSLDRTIQANDGVSGFSETLHGMLQTSAQIEPAAGVPSTIAPARSGALVDGVLCGTGAADAGITAGDVITAVAGRPVSSPDALTAVVSRCRPGTVVSVTWISATGAARTSRVRLEAAPAA